jgi:YebC/PmpR family DNA-binding regulatory protein
MSGHSKWANIKHKKAAADAKKGKIFSKLAKEIMIVAKSGGGDASANPSLRMLIQKARAVNMPADNIDRAIKKGTGELQAAALEEVMYEGYASGGVALIVQVLTDNKNRSAAEVRHLFTRNGANLATQGSVLRTFKRKGHILIAATAAAEDRLMEVALEAGAEDLRREDDAFVVIAEPASYVAVMDALAKAGIATESSEITMLPEVYVPIADKAQASSLMRFVDALEDLEDVQNVYTNMDIDEAVLAEAVKE